MKQLLVFILQVEYPAGGNSFLAPHSRMVESLQEMAEFVSEMSSEYNKDGYKVINSIMYTVPESIYKDK